MFQRICMSNPCPVDTVCVSYKPLYDRKLDLSVPMYFCSKSTWALKQTQLLSVPSELLLPLLLKSNGIFNY